MQDRRSVIILSRNGGSKIDFYFYFDKNKVSNGLQEGILSRKFTPSQIPSYVWEKKR